jgi:choline-sulfatase
MYATTCDLAKVPIPKAVEFPSLVPLLLGGSEAVHDAVFCYYREFQRMLRTKDYKLIVYPQINRTQLFDLKQDPWEMHDLSDDPAHASIKSDLMQQLARMQKDMGDPLVLRDGKNKTSA